MEQIAYPRLGEIGLASFVVFPLEWFCVAPGAQFARFRPATSQVNSLCVMKITRKRTQGIVLNAESLNSKQGTETKFG